MADGQQEQTSERPPPDPANPDYVDECMGLMLQLLELTPVEVRRNAKVRSTANDLIVALHDVLVAGEPPPAVVDQLLIVGPDPR